MKTCLKKKLTRINNKKYLFSIEKESRYLPNQSPTNETFLGYYVGLYGYGGITKKEFLHGFLKCLHDFGWERPRNWNSVKRD